jgi:hypothetical protein
VSLINLLSVLYEGAAEDETWCFGHMRPNGRMEHTMLSAGNVQDAKALVDGLTLSGQHVWLRSATGGQKVSEAQRQYFVSLDVDLAGPGHKAGNNPPDAGPIDRALVSLGLLRPTFVVKTGGGYLYVWKLAQPQVPDRALCRALQEAVRREITPFALDATYDVVRLIRIPEGRNFKQAYGPEFPVVEVVEENPDHVLTADELRALAPPPPPRRVSSIKEDAEAGTPRADSILAGCARLRRAGESPADQTEPQWMCAAAIFAACKDIEGFLDWSRGHPGFDERETREKYALALAADMGVTYARLTEVFGPDPNDPFEHGGVHSPLTLGFKAPAFVRIAAEWVYLGSQRAYYRLSDGWRLDHRAFDDWAMGTPGIGRPLHSELRRWPAAPKVEQIDYRPGQGRFPGSGVLNAWTAGGVEPAEGDWSSIETLTKHLFPVEAERAVILDVLAFHLQHPGVKIRWGFVMRGRPGTGKGLLANIVIPQLVGTENHRSVRGDALSARWTAELADTQYLFVDEMRQPDGYDAANRFKTILTDDRISVEQKHAALRMGTAPPLVVMASNNFAFLPVEPGDRRYYIPVYVRERLPAEVADSLLRDLQGQCAAFSHWLRARDVRHFNPNSAPPDTPDKLAIIRQTRPGVEALIEDAIHDRAGPFALDLVTPNRVRQWLAGAGENTSLKAIANALSALGAQRLGSLQAGDCSTEGRSAVWAVRNVDSWRFKKSREWGSHLGTSHGLQPETSLHAFMQGHSSPHGMGQRC